MSTDPKAQPDVKPATPAATATKSRADRGILIFTYPKIIFLFPTAIAALICAIGMSATGDNTEFDPATVGAVSTAPAADGAAGATTTTHAKFKHPANMFGLLFLMTLFFNLLIIAIDFPRFTVVAIALFGTTAIFFLLWLGMYVNWLSGLAAIFGGVYAAANSGFYLLTLIALGLVYGVIFATRWLDYWEILPNEILHHHGPWSDLERFPTMNLKFDKEIPDIFEHFMFGAGRLVLRVPSEDKSIVLDNVLHVSRKEAALKQLMSRLEVRVTTDQEISS